MIYSGSTDNLKAGSPVVLEVEGQRAEKRIEALRPYKKHFLLRLEGVNDIDEAEGYRAAEMYLREEDLADPGEDGYYWSQVVGLAVEDEEGRRVGEVTEVMETPAHDVFICRSEASGEEFLVPAVRRFVAEVDVKGGRVRLRKNHGLV